MIEIACNTEYVSVEYDYIGWDELLDIIDEEQPDMFDEKLH